MTVRSSALGDEQSLRRNRMLMATATYAFGFVLLALSALFGLFPWIGLCVVFGGFTAVNSGFLLAVYTNLNLRLTDPSMTLPQIRTAAISIGVILLFGERIHFMAVPFYSVLFVFAMLRLNRQQLISFEIFLLATYSLALCGRHLLFGERLDERMEVISALLIVVSSMWFATAATYISRLRARLGTSLRSIEQQAMRDGLTGVWNRSRIEGLLEQEVGRSEIDQRPISVCMLDLDHFKSINDDLGHLEGDNALRKTATALQAQLRPIDHLGRFGGEEFLVVLPGVGTNEAAACAERLRLAISTLNASRGQLRLMSVSIGVATRHTGEPPVTLLARADAALYDAKRAGRNRVSTAGSDAGIPPIEPG